MKVIGSALCAVTEYGYTEDMTLLPSLAFPLESAAGTGKRAASSAPRDGTGRVIRNVEPLVATDAARLSAHPMASQIARVTERPSPDVPAARTAELVGLAEIGNAANTAACSVP